MIVFYAIFRDMFPGSRNLFLYRDIVTASKSLYRIAYPMPALWLVFKLGRLSGSLTGKAVDAMGFCGRDYAVRLPDNLYGGLLLNCVLMKEYRELRARGLDVMAVRYEDLLRNPEESIRRVFEYCRLPIDIVKPALRGLEVDSQRNSVLAKSIIGQLAEPELTPDVIARANALLSKHRLPLVGEECLLEGTITADN